MTREGVVVIRERKPRMKKEANMRTIIALVTVILLLSVSSITAFADDGPSKALNPRDPQAKRTASERAVIAAKEERLNDHWAAQRRWLDAKGGITTMSIPDPGGSWPYSRTLSVSPRQQEQWYWCGPASTQAVQLFRNGSMSSQYTIAVFQNTINDGQTYVWRERDGLNNFVSKPAGFTYLEYQPPTDGHWWVRLQEDIADASMPMVVSVSPHDPDSALWIPSWPSAVWAGHYIVLTGYTGYNYAGGSVTYIDSSAGFSGGTGTYSTTSETMRYAIVKSSPYHAGNWIIW